MHTDQAPTPFRRTMAPPPPVPREAERSRWSHRFWLLAVLALLLLPGLASAQSPITRYVKGTDTTCQGHTPWYATIQAAVTAVQAGETIRIQAGTYSEQVSIVGKNIIRDVASSDDVWYGLRHHAPPTASRCPGDPPPRPGAGD